MKGKVKYQLEYYKNADEQLIVRLHFDSFLDMDPFVDALYEIVDSFGAEVDFQPIHLPGEGRYLLEYNDFNATEHNRLKWVGLMLPVNFEEMGKVSEKTKINAVSQFSPKNVSVKIMSAPNLRALNGDDRFQLLSNAVEYENHSRPDARIFILQAGNLLIEDNLDNNEQLLKDIEDIPAERFRLIVRQGEHFTAVEIDKANKRAVILDAAGDPRSKGITRSLKLKEYTLYVASGYEYDPYQTRNQQGDGYSCSLFSFDHCVQLSHLSQSQYDTIMKAIITLAKTDFPTDDAAKFYWNVLPPNFQRNTQSMKILDLYRSNHPDPRVLSEPTSTGLSYQEYLKIGSQEHLKCQYPQNDSINIHVLRELQNRYVLNRERCALNSNRTVAEMKEKLYDMKEIEQKPADSSPSYDFKK